MSSGTLISRGLLALGRMDRLAAQDTPIHRVDPRAKVLATLVFLVCVVSYGRYEVAAMIPFVIFPIALATLGGLPFGFIARRLLIAAPFAVMVGMFNPLLDSEAIARIGGLDISGGWVSFTSIVMRFLLTTAAALCLISTTGLFGLAGALQRLGVPAVFTTQLILLYRYIFVLAEEAMRLSRARALRSFGHKGMGLSVYGQILGNLLLRTFERGRRVYEAMLCRGFYGQVSSGSKLRFRPADAFFVLGWSGLFVFFRLVDLPLLLGSAVIGGVG